MSPAEQLAAYRLKLAEWRALTAELHAAPRRMIGLRGRDLVTRIAVEQVAGYLEPRAAGEAATPEKR